MRDWEDFVDQVSDESRVPPSLVERVLKAFKHLAEMPDDEDLDFINEFHELPNCWRNEK